MVKVSFFPHRINYTFHDIVHCQDDRNTVDYIYLVMRLMNLKWMKKVLSFVRKPYSLSMLCKMNLPLAPQESIFRRFVTPPATVIREMCFRGALLDGDEYGMFLKNYLSRKRSIFESSNILSRPQQTIYMHDLFFYGPRLMVKYLNISQ